MIQNVKFLTRDIIGLYGLVYAKIKKIFNQVSALISILSCRKSYILMSPNSIGEISIVCAFCKAFKEKYNRKLVLVVREDHYIIANLYRQHIDKIIIAPISLMRRLNWFRLSRPNVFKPGHPVNLWTKLRGDGRLDEVHELRGAMPSRGGLGVTDIYRHMMHLDWDSRIQFLEYDKLQFESRNGDLLKYKNNNEKMVLLFPSTNSNKPVSGKYWTAVAEKYFSEGYTVFCNYKGGAYTEFSPPAYINILDLDIISAIHFSNFCNSIVIGSNGLVVLMLLLKINTSINVLLSNEIMSYDAKGFRSYPLLSTSHRLGTPELINQDSDFREFMLDDSVNSIELAEAVVSKIKTRFELTDDYINSVLKLNREHLYSALTYNTIKSTYI